MKVNHSSDLFNVTKFGIDLLTSQDIVPHSVWTILLETSLTSEIGSSCRRYTGLAKRLVVFARYLHPALRLVNDDGKRPEFRMEVFEGDIDQYRRY